MRDAPYLVEKPQRESPEEFNLLLRKQINVIRSALVLDAALKDSTVARISAIKEQKNHIAWLREQVEVKAFDGGDSLVVSMKSSSLSSTDAAAVVNAISDAFVAIYGKMQVERSQQMIEILHQELKRRAGELEKLRTAVRALAKMVASAGITAAIDDPLALAQASSASENDQALSHLNDLQFLVADLKRAQQLFDRIADRAEIMQTELRAPSRARILVRAK